MDPQPSAAKVGVGLRQLRAFNFVESTTPATILADGGKYIGDLKKVDFQGTSPPIPHGTGYCLLPDGVSRYGGEWKDGKYHGQGALMTEDYTYEGEWENGAMHGMGTMGYKDTILKMVVRGIQMVSPFETKHRPAEYRGQFHHTHHRHGHGVMVYQSGDCYEGDWCKNMRDGQGTMKFADGEKYVGQWVNDERCGTGTTRYRDGSVFTGGMVKDKRHGDGVLRFSNGDEYKGNFEEDTINGFGTMVYKNGDSYNGNWRDGYRHGSGEFTLKRSGAKIRGTFFKGLAHGPNCTGTLPGRYTFKGQYKKGERTKGTMWINDGSVYMGEWQGDLMHGQGLLWYPDGDFYYGQFAKGKRTGRGSLTVAKTGIEYAGSFVDDVWVGEGATQDRDGSISSGLFRSGPGKEAACVLPPTSTIKAPQLIEAQQQPGSESQPQSSQAPPPPLIAAQPLMHGYQGEWDGFDLAGLGNLYHPNGDHFFGLFREGLRHGKGILKKAGWDQVPDGGFTSHINMGSQNAAAVSCIPATAAGTWVNDKLQGSGTVKYMKGTVYQGDWVEGLREGIGQFRDNDGNIYHGEWKQDIQHGDGALFLVNKNEPIYLHPAPPAPGDEGPAPSQSSIVGRMLGALWGGSSSSAQPVEKPKLLGYEDLCVVVGSWGRESSHRHEIGKLVGTATLYFTDLYEKIYETQYIGNKQLIQVPMRFIPPVQAPPTTTTPPSSVQLPNDVFVDLAEPVKLTTNDGDGSGIDPLKCSMCASSYSFFRKPIPCTVCKRVACSSCLKDCHPVFLNKGKGVASLKAPTLAVNGTAPACPECQHAVKEGTVLATQWFTFRRHDIGGSFASSGAPTPKVAPSSEDGQEQSPTRGGVSALPCQLQVYKGYLTEGNVPCGPGVLWKGNEACYIGYFKGGHRSGLGCVRFVNGEEYIGGWSSSAMHGAGIYRSDDGVCYEGDFVAGRLKVLRYQGEMHALSLDPDREYLGAYVRHGRGIACYEDGSRYNGEWDHGQRHGTGILQMPDGSVFTGHFSDDVIHGTGKLVSMESVFVGNYKEGTREGFGLLVTGLRTAQGNWVNGTLSGIVRVWDMDRNDVTDCIFFNGEERSDVFPIPMHQHDTSVSTCNACSSPFGMFLRRHHCRLCGKIYCDPCSKGRSMMPLHFGREEPQRVCNNCRELLRYGSTLAIKRYSDRGMYVGQWCKGRWAGKGLYRCPDGKVVKVNTPHIPHSVTVPADARPKLTNPSTEPTDVDEGGSVEDRRQQLAECPAATEEEVLAFTAWWDSLVRHAREDAFSFDLSERSVTDPDIMHPPTSLLPFDIKVFTPGNHAQLSQSDERAVSRRHARFRRAHLPPMPMPPLSRRPTRPRRIVEPTDESVYDDIRQARIAAFSVSSPTESTSREADLPPAQTNIILSSVSRIPLNQPTPPKPVLAELEPVTEDPSGEDASNTSAPAPAVDPAAPSVEWHNWEPRAAPKYKGTTFSITGTSAPSLPGTVIGAVSGGGGDAAGSGLAVSGETLGFSGGINIVHVVGLDSGPLEFPDVPQRFEVQWNPSQNGPPPVSQAPKGAVGGGVSSHFGLVEPPLPPSPLGGSLSAANVVPPQNGSGTAPSPWERTDSTAPVSPVLIESLHTALNPRVPYSPATLHSDPNEGVDAMTSTSEPSVDYEADPTAATSSAIDAPATPDHGADNPSSLAQSTVEAPISMEPQLAGPAPTVNDQLHLEEAPSSEGEAPADQPGIDPTGVVASADSSVESAQGKQPVESDDEDTSSRSDAAAPLHPVPNEPFHGESGDAAFDL